MLALPAGVVVWDVLAQVFEVLCNNPVESFRCGMGMFVSARVRRWLTLADVG